MRHMSEPKKIGTSSVEIDPADHPSVQAWQELAPEHGGVPAGAGNRETTSELEERHMLARHWLDAKRSPVQHLSAELIVSAGLV